MSTLFQEQIEFTQKVARLIDYIFQQGYQCTFADAYRDPRVHGAFGEKRAYGEANSFHKKRLAVDLNLFKDGKWLTSTKDHEPIGIWWEKQGGTWGGRFRDGNHYSWGEK